MKVKSERELAQSCLTLSHPMDCSPPGSSVCGTFQARVLEWGAIAFSVQMEEIYPNSFGYNFIEIHLTYSTPHTFKINTLNFDMQMYTDTLVTTTIKIAICILDKLTYK